ncbi:hypothetical protein [Streptomyces flavofungini]|uniref:hypothetical protein n=1 Tax=Streptomyces flavofungini TaxID=68200 RepID=UPI0025B13800|nr:hypothetical protein [Streptomyces flavofungini]WJV46283.1 hypothetical protein QUY26_12485 [Streptomyces flavofungini]
MNAHDALNTLAVLGVFLLMALPSLVGHAHDRRIDRQLREAERGQQPPAQSPTRSPAQGPVRRRAKDPAPRPAQNSSSKETEPSTATWYADGRRSKKLVSS